MNDALTEALDLYRETRNGLNQRENDVEALLRVVVAADNLVQAVERQERTTRFIARLTEHLQDGKRPGVLRQLGFDSLSAYAKHLISAEYMPNKPQGAERNAIILSVRDQLPGMTESEYADIVGTSQPTVHRVLSGDQTGAGNRGHGGARK